MVTFALPGDNDAAAATNGTPRARPPLPFAKRSYGASPFAQGPSKHLGTPQSAPSRRFFSSRHDTPASALNKSSIATARNIFQASAISDSPPSGGFSPSLPQSTMKKVFAPGATPEPSRVYRESTASAAPRGMAAKTSDKELFPMRISSPPRELSGEVLAQKVPKDWNSKGSIYADQFLAHLCPPDLDEEQRRQFFCILDLRRLKYAANEIFARKDWKLNVINFAKEFEKSRSIILLRYGLYEFQNVKPSKDVLKRWRREHGLPEPEEEEVEAPVEPTPSKSVPSKKRKADDDLTKDYSNREASSFGKRVTTDKVGQEEPAPIATPQPGKNKRKASAGEEDQPAKRSTPSATKALFEKIANKPADAPAPKSNPFGSKPPAGGLARSVFTNLKAGAGQAPAAPAAGNIFGYLSDASSAKNSGADADAESDTDSDDDESPAAGQSKEDSGDASAAETPAAEDSTRESTPGRSLFDRVTKGNDGEPVRAAEPKSPEAAAPADKTWNPSTTPLKFAPSAAPAPAAPAAPASNLFGGPQSATPSGLFGGAKPAASNLFGSSQASASDKPATPAAESTPAGGIFAPKSTAPSNLFGAAKPASDKPAAPATGTGKDGDESDKENDSQPAKKPAFEFKPTGSASSSGLFGAKPAGTDSPAEPAKPASNLFGAPAAKPAASNLFGGDANKTGESTPVMQSSTLFGAKPAEPTKQTATEPAAAEPAASTTAAPLFGANSTTTSSNLFGGASAAPSKPLFGAVPKTDAPATSAPASAAPIFSFGGNSTTTSQPAAGKPLFAPKSPPASSGGAMFGSPMKQDEQSPAKKVFTGGNTTSAPASFTFGGANSTPSVNLFGGAVGNTAANGTSTSFGATPATNSGSGGFGFNFSAGGSGSAGNGGSTSTSFNNPFSGNSGSAPAAPGSGGTFNFGGASAGPASGASTPFQFGNAGGASAPNGGGSTFGGSNPASGNSTPVFGGGAPTGGAPAGAPAFNFTAASPAQPSGGGNMFGSSQAAPAFGNLQPPAGGSSTTGTNSPLNLAGSSLATTPAAGTPEPSAPAEAKDNNDEEGEKHEQISLTEGAESEEETVHEVRAKVLKFVSPEDQSDDEKPKSKSPWTTKGVGPLRVLKHKETNAVRLLLRAEPRGHVALNKTLLPDLKYKANEKYVRLGTPNEKGDGMETWMIQVKTKDLAKALADALEENKVHNKKD